MGQKDGEHLAGQIANGWGGLKQSAGEGQQSFTRFFSTVNNPEQWIGRSRRQ